jgi:glycosyltransferase involved in cell wall biosynthesis
MPPSKPELHKSRVSVVIPCYNHARFLSDAVESVAIQTLPCVEVIIVNDGSTDNTSEVVRNLKSRYANMDIKIVEQTNRGLVNSRNNGIKNASGEYIFVLDADDKIHPEALKKMALVLNQNKRVGLVYSYVRYFGMMNDIRKLPKFDIKRHLKRNITVGNCMFRTKAWDEVGGYNPNMKYGYEDWDFTLSLHENGWKFYLIEEALFYYRKSGLSMIDRASHYRNFLRSQVVLNHPKLFGSNDRETALHIMNEYDVAAKLGEWTKGPMISVVLYNFRDCATLERSLINLHEQKYKSIEILLMNSVDNLTPLDIYNSRYKIIGNNGSHTTASLKNEAIENATGKFVVFWDAACQYNPEHLGSHVQYLEESEIGASYSEIIYEQIIIDDKQTTMMENNPLADGFPIKSEDMDVTFPLIPIVYNQQMLKGKYKFNDRLLYFEDWELLTRLLDKSDVAHIRKITAKNHHDSFTITDRNINETLDSLLELCRTTNAIRGKLSVIWVNHRAIWMMRKITRSVFRKDISLRSFLKSSYKIVTLILKL